MSTSAAPNSRAWHRAGASFALAAVFAFAFQPYFPLAQTADSDTPPQAQPKPKAPAKKPSRHTATDFVSDDLNRRESERAAKMVEEIKVAGATAVPQAATSAGPAVGQPPGGPVTPSALPARAPLVTASVTPGIANGSPAGGSVPPVARAVTADVTAPPASPMAVPAVPLQPPGGLQSIPLPPRQMAQAPRPAPAPAPVPIQPPSAAGGGTPTVISGATGRTFGQGQVVPPQQPTLTLEVNKGTALRLPGPASTVFVAAPDIADVQVKSPTMIYVFAKKAGDTVLYAVDAQDRVLLNTIVSVTSPVSRMKLGLDAVHPGNGVTFSNQGETIVLGGTVRSALIAEDARRLALQHVNGVASKVINNIRIDAPNQVQLRVKVAEVQRDALKRIGINWQNINNIALFGLGPFQAGFAVQTVQSTGGPGSGALSFASNNNSLTSFIDFLATQSKATVLAEPNLIAMSGETASFLAGSEIPVIAPQAGLTGSTISVTYKPVGVSLSFTPTLVGDRINLKVAPEVSQVTTNGQVSVPLTATATVVVPAVETRRASTTVELASGQSFAIAGLLFRTGEQDITKLPWLGDIPILGSLFKSDAYQRGETELVIIVTPYIVEPTSGPLRTPLTGDVPPTDADRIIYQRTSHPTPPQQIQVGGERQGVGQTAGFKLD